MILSSLLLLVGYCVLLTALAVPVGAYLARVVRGERTWLSPAFAPVERALYRACGVGPEQEMEWPAYTRAMLAFSLVSTVALYALLRLQQWLPGNPDAMGAVAPDLAFNTAVSFVSNTNWQAYAGESTMSHAVQMAGLAVQNFCSAAVGIAVAVALVRGLARSAGRTLGNFWVDLVRVTLYVLLPLSVVLALFLASQGVIQNFSPTWHAATLTGGVQQIPMGPVASQEAIKELGTNGGGFFNANSAHPFENPTPLTNLVEMLAIFLIPAGLTMMYGRMVGDRRQGWTILAAMFVLFIAGALVCMRAEQAGNPLLTALGVDQHATALQAGGNMEGKEVRFGPGASALFATITTDASCGAVNAMHDSFTPLGGMVPLVNIMLGEVIFGGVGSGLYGMVTFVVLSVFIAGLMVGRTPEYLGKKIEAREVKLAMVAILILAFTILGFGAWGAAAPTVLASLGNAGPHGLSELLYAFTSAAGNNGSAFAGFAANTTVANVTLALAMIFGRFFFMIPVLGIAGSMVRKVAVPPSPGTFPTNTPLFALLLVLVILIVGGLTFFPALSLGPILEHVLMQAGRVF